MKTSKSKKYLLALKNLKRILEQENQNKCQGNTKSAIFQNEKLNHLLNN